MNRLFFAGLLLVALLGSARAQTPPKLTGTLFNWVPGNGCGGYDALLLTSNTSSGVWNDTDAFGSCILELAVNAKGAMVALDQNQAQEMGKSPDWWNEVQQPGRSGVYQGSYYADVIFAPFMGQKRVRLKAIVDDQKQPLLRGGLALSSDGNRVAFESNPNVLVRNRAGELLATLPRSRGPSWSLDGRLVVVCSVSKGPGDSLCLHDPKAKTIRILPRLPNAAYALNGANLYALEQPAFSPDGKTVAVTVLPFQDDTGAPEYLSRVWMLDLPSNKWTRALELPPELVPLSSVQAPVWSPDGKVLALTVNGRLTFVDLGTHKLMGRSSTAFGQKVYMRPVWAK